MSNFSSASLCWSNITNFYFVSMPVFFFSGVFNLYVISTSAPNVSLTSCSCAVAYRFQLPMSACASAPNVSLTSCPSAVTYKFQLPMSTSATKVLLTLGPSAATYRFQLPRQQRALRFDKPDRSPDHGVRDVAIWSDDWFLGEQEPFPGRE